MLTLKDTCSTREAAERLNVALSTVQSWVEIGALEAWKTPGGHRRVLNSSVDRLLKEGLRKPKAKSEVVTDSEPDPFRVLVVEDEPMEREIYAGFFRQLQFPISASFCENGYEALLRIGHEVPHLVITDLSMPEMDGFQMIRALRQFKLTSGIPIITISGLSDFDIAEQGGLPEDVLLLHKPIDFVQFHELMNKTIERYRNKSLGEALGK